VIDLDLVVTARAHEQARAAKLDHTWERDSWALVGPETRPVRARMRSRCLAGDCAARPTKQGYCHAHYMKVRNGVALDVDVRLKRCHPRRTS